MLVRGLFEIYLVMGFYSMRIFKRGTDGFVYYCVWCRDIVGYRGEWVNDSLLIVYYMLIVVFIMFYDENWGKCKVRYGGIYISCVFCDLWWFLYDYNKVSLFN